MLTRKVLLLDRVETDVASSAEEAHQDKRFGEAFKPATALVDVFDLAASLTAVLKHGQLGAGAGDSRDDITSRNAAALVIEVNVPIWSLGMDNLHLLLDRLSTTVVNRLLLRERRVVVQLSILEQGLVRSVDQEEPTEAILEQD